MSANSIARAQDPACPHSSCNGQAWAGIPQSAFRHEMLFYEDGDHGFIEGTLELVQHALGRGAGVLIAVRAQRAAALSDALDADAGRVCFAPLHSLGRNPARIIPIWREFVREHAIGGGGNALGIGEPVWPGRGPAELDECERHEALLNLAFNDGPGWHLLCPYDLDGLDDVVINAARRTHPLLAWGEEHQANARYACAHAPPHPFAGDLPAPTAPVTELAFSLDSLSQIRHAVSAWASEQAIEQEGNEELVLAVDELAANSVRHGGGAGILRYWREDAVLMCEVRDAGWFHAPLVGRIRPAVDAHGGRGVWLANQLCDLVQIRSSYAGSVVRVHKRLED